MNEEQMEIEIVKEKKKTVSRAVVITMVFTLFVMGGGILLSWTGLNKDLINILILIGITVALYFVCRPALPEGWPVKTANRCSIWSFLAAAGLISLYQLVLALFSLSGDAELTRENSTMYILYMGFLVPICEEVMFRGYVMEPLRKYGSVFAIVGSSFLFGLYHCNAFQLITASVIGLLFGYFAMRYSLFYTILLHMLNNGLYATLLKPIANSLGMPLLTVIVPGAFTLLGVIAWIRLKPIDDIKNYLSQNPTDKRDFRYIFLNGWILLIAALVVAATIGLAIFVLPQM